MSHSTHPDFDSLSLAQRIIDLDAEVWREVRARQYERAAELRDKREAFLVQLAQAGDPTMVQNVKRALSGKLGTAPVLSLLEQDPSVVDNVLLRALRDAPTPPRWVLKSYHGTCRATLANLLDVDAQGSPYFQAQLPVFSAATLFKATHPREWLAAAIREAARGTSAVVWIVKDLAYLADRGVLDGLLQVLHCPTTPFVLCMSETDDAHAGSVSKIPNVAEISV